MDESDVLLWMLNLCVWVAIKQYRNVRTSEAKINSYCSSEGVKAKTVWISVAMHCGGLIWTSYVIIWYMAEYSNYRYSSSKGVNEKIVDHSLAWNDTCSGTKINFMSIGTTVSELHFFNHKKKV